MGTTARYPGHGTVASIVTVFLVGCAPTSAKTKPAAKTAKSGDVHRASQPSKPMETGLIPDLIEQLRAVDCSLCLTRHEYLSQLYGRWSNAADKLITLGDAAASATPALAEMVRSGAWDQRPIAARVLVYVGDKRAEEALTQVLEGPDWRVTYYAAQALGRIGGETTVPFLQRLMREHWSRGVRKAARDAVRRIRGDASVDETATVCPPHSDHSPVVDHEPSSCGDPKTVAIQYQWGDTWLDMGPSWFFERSSRHTEAGRLIIPKELRAVTTVLDDPNMGPLWVGVIAEKRRMEPIVDVLTIAGPNGSAPGWLVGTNRGEWGGRLLFISSGGDVVQIWDVNVSGVARWGDRVVVISGLAHMGMARQLLLSDLRRTDAGWSIQPFFQLPESVRNYRIHDNTLFLWFGEQVLAVDVNGSAEYLSCRVRPE